jgi:hypothetical protein
MNKWPTKGDSVTFLDPDTSSWRDGEVIAVHSWAPEGIPSVMVQYVNDAGWTVSKFVNANEVHARGYDRNAKCECGSEKVGHSGHAYYCPKAVQ